MAKASPAAHASTLRLKILLGLLAVLLVTLVVMIPRLMAMLAEARRLDALNEARMADVGKAAGPRMAAASAREEARRKPQDPQANLMAAQALLQSGETREAVPYAEAAVRLNPRSPGAWIILAELRRQERRLYDAIQAYRSCLAVDPVNGPATAGLASLYISLGWTRDAWNLLEPAVRRNPRELPLKVALAMTALQSDDFKTAEKLLLEVRAAAPDEGRLWGPLVSLYNTQKRYSEARAAAEHALSIQPDDALRNELAISLYRMNKTPEAMEQLRKTLASAPENAPARYYLALCLQRQGDTRGAVEQLERVNRASPDYEQTRMILGNLYIRSGRLEEGRRLLSEAKTRGERGQRRARLGLIVAAKPASADAHFELARIYQADGDIGRAVVELHKTLEIAPAHQSARQLLRSLEPSGAK